MERRPDRPAQPVTAHAVQSAPLGTGGLPGTMRDGRYQLLGAVADGGSARVFRARDTMLGREVALKVLSPEFARDPARVERFRLEARRIAALQHPSIVPLLDYGEEGGQLFLVMPYYATTAREVLMQQGPLAPQWMLAIVAQVAAALDFAHQNGFIHRDVKPENILLDSASHAYLSDFGISTSGASAPSHLATSAPLRMAEAGSRPMVTVEYSAPEHLLGRQTTPQSDVYGLGIVAYELLTGNVPFSLDDDRLYLLLTRILTETPTPPSQHARIALSAAVDEVIVQAIDRDPARRFATATAFSQALAQAFSASPAPRPTLRPVPAPMAPPTAPPIRPRYAPLPQPPTSRPPATPFVQYKPYTPAPYVRRRRAPRRWWQFWRRW